MAVNKEVRTGAEESQVKQFNTMPMAYFESSREDEINLLDLWCVLVKRKNILFSVFLLCLLMGLSYALLKPRIFEFSTAIEIGTKIQGAEFISIEEPVTVLEKINRVYIPVAISQYMDKDPETRGAPDIKSGLGKGSSIINLYVRGKEDDQPDYFGILNNIAASVITDHQRISSIERKEIELTRNRVNNSIIKLKEQGELFKAQNLRLNEKIKLLEKRIKNIQQLIADSEKAKKEAVRKASTEGKALALMIMDNDLRKANQILAELQEELYITIENQRDVLANNLAENERNQSEQQDNLVKIDIQLANLLETRAIVEPMKSYEPVGQGKKIIVLVSMIVGVFLGLFLVFIIEFLDKARQYAADKSESV
ncbi:MAG: Wzz/FepE/Etk N-terminal domain-containing protein [Gammaproteobacteria bacterium]|nr:Wzz/FepE/Etk N-terminal domain-containing protein [Gammaproteobacteria bacterium]